jgi:uncharacterized protein (TIGR03435 family)
MIRSRPHALAGALGSLVIHAFLLAVLANLPMSNVPPSSSSPDAAGSAANSLGRGFPGHSNSRAARGQVLGDSAGVKEAQAGVNATRDRTTPARASLGPAAQTIAAALRPVIDYRNWSPARVTRHLVESTLFVLVVFLLTLLLRRSSARIRYGLWLSASLKFFVPFSALVGVGAAIGVVVPRSVDLGRPFASSAFDSLWMSSHVGVSAARPSLATATHLAIGLGALAAAVWIIGSMTMAVMRYRLWRRVQAAVKASTPLTLTSLELPPGVELRSAPGVLEPGVIGWRRPVLLLPDGIVDRLKPEELQAVLAHECCHVRRRDNLTAALHMLTEVVFWFHPAVWLIGTRLLAERERACDESVLAEGYAPTTYARAIVKTCATYVTSPVACVAGVTGSKIAARIQGILRDVPPDPVRGWRKAAVLLTFVGVAAGPIGYGVGRATPRIQATAAQTSADIPPDPVAGAVTFEAASVRLNKSGLQSGTDDVLPNGRYVATNLPLAVFIRLAYTPAARHRSLEPFEVRGGPDWRLSDRFDINATAGRDASPVEIRAMLRALLAERFQVKTHVEQRRGPAFRLSMARPGRLGPQLRRSEADCNAIAAGQTREAGSGTDTRCGFFGPAPTAPIGSTRAYQALRGMTMDEFAVILSAYLGRHVVNSTGLSGAFDGDMEFTAEIMLPPPPSGPNPFDGTALPSIFSVLPQQLGLRLERTDAPQAILVIDHAAHPTEN